MTTLFETRKSPLAQLSWMASYGAKLPQAFAITIEALSFLQILFIILGTSFPSLEDESYFIFHYLRKITSLLGLLSIDSTFDSKNARIGAWLIISLYLLLYFSFMVFLLACCYRKKRFEDRVANVCTWMSIIHGKVLFCPIYFFYLKVLISGEFCNLITEVSYHCDNIIKSLTILFIVINTVLAIIKETCFYQVYNNQNPFAVKSNIHAMIHLVFKIILMPLMTDKYYNSTVNSLLNVIFTVLHHLFIFLKLPYFQTKCLKIAVVYSTIQTTFSLILFWKIAANSSAKKFELLLVLITSLIVKVMLIILNYIFKQILDLKVTSPAYVTHLAILVNENIFNQLGIDLKKKFEYYNLYASGVLKNTGFDIIDMRDRQKVKEFKFKINQAILDEMLKCYQKNPGSKIILFYLFQFYCKKMKNISKATIYIEKFKALPLFISEVIAIMHMKKEVQRILFNVYSQYDQSLECIGYFKYRAISEKLKNDIELEVNEHIEFWQMLSKEKISLQKMTKTCHKIDKLASQIERTFVKNESDFVKHFPAPLIMYGTYLNIIRGLPHLGQGFIDNFSHGKNIKLMKKMERWFSQEKAIIVASCQKGCIGKVLDASYSVKNLFHIKKEDLIGRKINLLMPNMIQEQHDEIMQRYNEKPIYAVDFNRPVYCKTIKSQFFLANLNLTVYPNVDQGSALIATLTRKEKCIPMFFVNIEGTIVDCSKELADYFHIDFTMRNKVKLQDLAPDFERINSAFNINHYSSSKRITQEQSDQDLLPVKISQKDSKEFRQNKLQIEITPRTLNKELDDIPASTRRLLINSPTYVTQEWNSGNLSERGNESPRLLEGNSPIFPKAEKEPFQVNLIDLDSHDFQNKIKPQSMKNDMEKSLENKELNEIYKAYQNEAILTFRMNNSFEENDSGLMYNIKIETFLFEGQLYKVVKMMKKLNNDENFPQTPKWKSITKRKNSLFEVSGAFSANIPKESRKDEFEGFGRNSHIIYPSFQKTGTNSEEKYIDQKNSKHTSMEPNLAALEQKYETKNETSSKGTSNDIKDRNTRIEKVFHQILSEAKAPKITTAFFVAFYASLAASLIYLVINFLEVKSQFNEIKLGAQLVDINSERLLNLINAWSSAVFLYSCVLLPPAPINVAFFSPIIQTGNNEIIRLNTELIQTLKAVESKEMIQQFFVLNTVLWESDGNGNYNSFEFDEFSALKLQLSKLLIFTKNISRPYFQSRHEDLILALNNTINDLLLSIEGGFTNINAIKAETYDEVNSWVKFFIAFQSVFICITLISIISYIVNIFRSYNRMLRTIYIISIKSILSREAEVVRFKQCLRESVESVEFIQSFDEIVKSDGKNFNQSTVKTDFKQTTTFTFKTAKLNAAYLLLISIVLLSIIIGLIIFYSLRTLNTLDILYPIDEGISIVQIMGYQTFLGTGNIIYWMSFYNRTDMLMRNEPLGVQMKYNMEIVQKANERIINAFPMRGTDFYDEDIDDFLSRDVCSYLPLNPRTAIPCESATDGHMLGLLGLNSKLHDMYIKSVFDFEANPTYDNYLLVLNQVVKDAGSSITIISLAYRYLRARLLTLFITKIQEQEKSLSVLFIIIFVCTGIMGLFIRLVTLSRLKRFDKIRFKILKVLPLPLMLENRSFLFYLRLEFSSELKQIQSIL